MAPKYPARETMSSSPNGPPATMKYVAAISGTSVILRVIRYRVAAAILDDSLQTDWREIFVSGLRHRLEGRVVRENPRYAVTGVSNRSATHCLSSPAANTMGAVTRTERIGNTPPVTWPRISNIPARFLPLA